MSADPTAARIDRAGISADVVFTVNRTRSTFADDIGNERECDGTGFWLDTLGRPTFVTNKHNLAPSLKYADLPRLRLTRLQIELRCHLGDSQRERAVFCEVPLASATLIMSAATDCAIVLPIDMLRPDASFLPFSMIREEHLADAVFFRSDVMIMETVFFIGYPGRGGHGWFDTARSMPVAREAIFASVPAEPFVNPAVTIDDALLVSGFAFSGSSGSPVILPRHGISPGGGIVDPAYRPAKVVGVMASALFDAHDMFRHTGLSILVRSTAILDLLEQARARGVLSSPR